MMIGYTTPFPLALRQAHNAREEREIEHNTEPDYPDWTIPAIVAIAVIVGIISRFLTE